MSITVRRATPRDAAAYARLMSHPSVFGNLMQLPMPTEELWHALGDRKNGKGEDYPLITAKWPAPKTAVDAEAKAEIEWLIELLTNLRSIRREIRSGSAMVPPRFLRRTHGVSWRASGTDIFRLG